MGSYVNKIFLEVLIWEIREWDKKTKTLGEMVFRVSNLYPFTSVQLVKTETNMRQ